MAYSVLLLISVMLTAGMTFLMMWFNQRELRETLSELRAHQQELLNRIQSKDLHAFATMQANTLPVSSEEPQYARTDEAEARRMLEMYGASEGVGDVIYSDEEYELLSDLGLRE